MDLPPPGLQQQRAMWNEWNRCREDSQDESPLRQAGIVEGWLADLKSAQLEILDVGCGAGWLEPRIAEFGRVTATDLADEVLDRARARNPDVNFIAGDFMEMPFPDECFDVVVSLEVLAHVADQAGFVGRLARLLRPDGVLMLATQNRPVLERLNDVPPPRPGQLRRWFDEAELRDLLRPDFVVDDIFSVTLKCSRRHPMRLLTSRRIDRALSPLVGRQLDAVRSAMERRGYGWTLMVRARRRP